MMCNIEKTRRTYFGKLLGEDAREIEGDMLNP